MGERYTVENPMRGVIGVLRREDRFLLIQRGNVDRAPYQWCFPGGGIEEGESERDALVREMREELSVGVEPLERLFVQTKHGGRLLLYWWSARLIGGEPVANPSEVAAFAWLTPDEVRGRSDVIPGTDAIFTHFGV